MRINGRKIAIVLGAALLVGVLGCAFALGQAKPAQDASRPTPAAPSVASLEFPVLLRQKVVAGKTSVGTKVQARLTVATFLNRVVVPEDAVFSGEVIESAKKSGTDPSRLGIRMDSVQWRNKNQSAPTVVSLTPPLYLTAWYYPLSSPVSKESMASQSDSVYNQRLGNNNGMHSAQRNGGLPPFGSADPDGDKNADKSTAPSSDVSNHRVGMKDVESGRGAEGAVTLSSKRFNLKLNKTTTYVLAAGTLGAGPS
jgi:hypothetical protein